MSDQVENPEDRFSHDEAHMNHIMRKPVFCICENKGADQLLGQDPGFMEKGFKCAKGVHLLISLEFT